MSLLRQVDSNQCKVGMRVQDNWGNCGAIKWVGKLEKNPPPPKNYSGDVGPKNVTYAGVEFDSPLINSPWRTDGTLGGVVLVPNAAPGTVAFLQPKKDLWQEVIPQAVAGMRSRFGDRIAKWHDVEVTKFCIARKFDMKAVVEMIENHLNWEPEHLVSTKMYFPPKMAVGYPVGLQPNKFDREGNLIRIERPGNGGAMHPQDFVSEFGLPLIMKWHIASVEQAKEQLRASGWKTQRITFIIDLANFGKISTDVAKFGQMEGKIDQDHYPEMMARAFMINAPWFFTGLWKIVRLFVDERTKEKIKILGSDYKEELLRYMEPDCLPKCAGGTNDGWLDVTNGGKVGGLEPEASPTTTELQQAALATPSKKEVEELEALRKEMEEKEARLREEDEAAEAARALRAERSMDESSCEGSPLVSQPATSRDASEEQQNSSKAGSASAGSNPESPTATAEPAAIPVAAAAAATSSA